MSPLFAARLISGREMEAGIPFAALLLGGFGLWGILQLTAKIMEPKASVVSAAKLRVYLALGLVSLITAAFLIGFEPGWFGLIFLLPALVVAHFVFLARGYLWGSS